MRFYGACCQTLRGCKIRLLHTICLVLGAHHIPDAAWITARHAQTMALTQPQVAFIAREKLEMHKQQELIVTAHSSHMRFISDFVAQMHLERFHAVVHGCSQRLLSTARHR